MSRIIVKNLPNNTKETALKEWFAKKGLITDIQLKYNEHQRFRNFAFIGYNTEDECEQALQHFNNTYFGANKITVEKCRSLTNENKPSEWSSTARPQNELSDTADADGGGSGAEKLQAKCDLHKKILSILDKYKNDELFKQFMDLKKMNEEELLKILNRVTKFRSKKSSDPKTSDFEYMMFLKKCSSGKVAAASEKQSSDDKKSLNFNTKNLFTLRVDGLPLNCKKQDLKEFFRPNLPKYFKIQYHYAFVRFKSEEKMLEALQKNKSFLRGHQIFLRKVDNIESKKERSEQDQKKLEKWQEQEKSLESVRSVSETGSLYYRNLAYNVTENNLFELFEKIGPIKELNLAIDRKTQENKGFGTVTFEQTEHAELAMAELDGTIFHGRLLHLLPSKLEPKLDAANENQSRDFTSKSNLNSNLNWNTLLINADTIARYAADFFETSRSEILNPSQSNRSAAVNLTMAEADLVRKTKQFFESQNINLDVFGQSMNDKRSKTVLIIKNLPYETTNEDVWELLQKQKSVVKVIVPPHIGTALVEFTKTNHAKKAFETLANKPFRNTKLLLEWAPLNVFDDAKRDDGNDERETAAASENFSTLYIRNLAADVTEKDIEKHFEKCGEIHKILVAYKRTSAQSAAKISMGYGFIQFKDEQSAKNALKTLQKSLLNGQCIELEKSQKKFENEPKGQRKKAEVSGEVGRKILVKNVPFEANKKDICDLFKNYGVLVSVRLPLKSATDPNSHRGFCFVEYGSSTDAKAAMDSLSASSHLYGRRLVLEWAKIDNSLEDVRKRVADRYNASETTASKRLKKSVFEMKPRSTIDHMSDDDDDDD